MISAEDRTLLQNQIDSSEQVKSHFYTADDGCYIRLSPTAWKILSGRESGKSFEQLAQELNRESEQEVTAENVESAWQYIDGKIQEIRKNSNPLRSGFWLKFPLMSSSVVTKVSSLLRPAFYPSVSIALLSLITITSLLFYLNFHRETVSIRPGEIAIAYLLYVFSMIIHEFGHSTACLYFGAKPSAIGFTLYLIYPAFYSDVSDAWRLRRWQRAVVDMSGMYFQFVVGAVYAIAWHYTAWQPFRMAVYGIIISFLLNLNPIFRFDGYWLMSDLLGVTNLGRQPFRLAKNLILRLRGRKPPPSPWTLRITLLLSVYSIAWFVFVIWFIWRLAPFVFSSFSNYPQLLSQNLKAIYSGSTDFDSHSFFSLLLSTTIIFAVSRLLWGLGLRAVFRRFVGSLKARLKRR